MLLLFKDYLIEKHELVARIVYIPVLRLSWAVTLNMMYYIHELAVESTEEHTVT